MHKLLSYFRFPLSAFRFSLASALVLCATPTLTCRDPLLSRSARSWCAVAVATITRTHKPILSEGNAATARQPRFHLVSQGDDRTNRPPFSIYENAELVKATTSSPQRMLRPLWTTTKFIEGIPVRPRPPECRPCGSIVPRPGHRRGTTDGNGASFLGILQLQLKRLTTST